MPILVRATTTSNAQGRRQQQQRLHELSTSKSNELDSDYFQALKIIEQTRRTQKPFQKSDAIRQRKTKSFCQVSTGLSPIGQEAMTKTYEDTLFTHLTNIYASKRITAILPRLPTAVFRDRLPMIKNNVDHRENIRQAQDLIDDIVNENVQKQDILYDYVRWQQNWTRNS